MSKEQPGPFKLPFDVGYLLIGSVTVTLIWGIACASVGGVLRFNLAEYVNDYISVLDFKKYTSTSQGMVAVSKRFDEVDLGSWSTTLGIIAIIVGVMVVIYSAIGLVAALLKNTTLIFVLIATVLICIMFQFAIIWMIYDSDNSFHDNAKTDLRKTLNEKYQLGPDANKFTKVMNTLMLAGKCCGIRGWGDFKYNISYDRGNGGVDFLRTSPACCREEIWDKALSRYSYLLKCVARTNEIYTRGCYNTIFNHAKERQMGTYLWLLALIMLWELIVIATAVLVLFSQEDESLTPVMQEQETEEEPEEEPEIIPFTPFSKLSSFPQSEVERIKSTEIW